MSCQYRNAIIDARAEGPSTLDNQWSAYVILSRIKQSFTEEVIFYIPARFRTKELAQETGLSYGRMKVDEMLA